MKLTVLSVPGCPNAGLLKERVELAVEGDPLIAVRHLVVDDELEASRAGMRGSPTLLVDGVDPFSGPDELPGLSCRLYPDAEGRAGGAPSVQAIRRALDGAPHE